MPRELRRNQKTWQCLPSFFMPTSLRSLTSLRVGNHPSIASQSGLRQVSSVLIFYPRIFICRNSRHLRCTLTRFLHRQLLITDTSSLNIFLDHIYHSRLSTSRSIPLSHISHFPLFFPLTEIPKHFLSSSIVTTRISPIS